MQFGEAFLSLIPQMDQSAVRRTEAEAHTAGQRVGKQYGSGFDKATAGSAGKAGAFGTALATMGAKATIGAAGVAAVTPAVLQLTAALVPAAGALIAYPGLLLGIKAASAVTKLAVLGVGDAIETGFTGTAKEAQEALKKLPPEARIFAQSVIGLQGNLKGLRNEVSDRFFDPINDSFKPFAEKYLPMANKEMPALAQALGATAGGFAEAATKGRLFDGVEAVFQNTTLAVAKGNDNIGAMTDGLGSLLVVSSSALPRLADGFNSGAVAAGNFLTEAEKSGQLERWINAGFEAIGKVVQILINLGSVISQVLGAAGRQSGDFLGTIVSLTAQMAAFFKSVEGNQALQNFFTVTGAISTALRQGLMMVLPQILDALKILAPAVAPLVGSFLQLVGAVSPLIPVAARLAVVVASVLAAAMSTLATALGPVIEELTKSDGAAGGMDAMATSAEKLTPAVTAAVSQVQSLTPALNLTGQALGFLIENTDQIVKWLPLIVAGFIAWKVAQLAANIAMAASVPIRIAEIIATRQQTAALTQLAIAQGVATGATTVGTGAVAANATATIGQRIAATASATATKAVAAAQWLWNAALTANPIGIVVVAIAALVAGIILAYKNSETFRAIVDKVWAAVKTAIGATVDWFTKTAWPAIKTAIDAAGEAFNWLWKNVIEPVWNGIKATISVVWTAVKIIFDALVAAVNVVGAIFMWLWQNVITPVWLGIKLAIDIAWVAIQIIFKSIEIAVKLLEITFMFFWQNVIVPVWNGIQLVIQTVWNFILNNIFNPIIAFLSTTFKIAWDAFKLAIELVWNAIQLVIQTVWNFIRDNIFIPIISFLRETLTPPWTVFKDAVNVAWEALKSLLQAGWNWIRDNVFQPLINFITKDVPSAFTKAVSAIGAAWDKVKEVAKVPVKFVVETVINKGIIAGFNVIARAVGVGEIQPVSLPFKRGGVLPGYTPGRDVHRFYSKTAGGLELSGGEAIIRPEATRALGTGFINSINQVSRSRGTGGVSAWLGRIFGGGPIRGGFADGGTLGFADGGILGGIKKGAGWVWDKTKDAGTAVKDSMQTAWDTFRNPAGTLKAIARALMANLPPAGQRLGPMLIGAVNKLVDGAGEWISDKFTLTAPGDGGLALEGGSGGPGNYSKMFDWVKSRFPGAQLYSGLRQSTTLSGNTSLHSSGRAIDITPDRSIANAIISTFGNKITELITPWPETHIWHGQSHNYSDALDRQHGVPDADGNASNAHIHWAMKLGGIISKAVMAQMGMANNGFAFDGGGWLTRGMIGVHRLRKPDAVLTNDEAKGLKNMGVGDLLGVLRELLEATRSIAPGVGGHINGVGRRVTIRGRIL